MSVVSHYSDNARNAGLFRYRHPKYYHPENAAGCPRVTKRIIAGQHAVIYTLPECKNIALGSLLYNGKTSKKAGAERRPRVTHNSNAK